MSPRPTHSVPRILDLEPKDPEGTTEVVSGQEPAAVDRETQGKATEQAAAATAEPDPQAKGQMMLGSDMPAPESRSTRRLRDLLDIREQIELEKRDFLRTEALNTARAIALAFLPHRKVEDRQLTRELRLGKDLVIQVTYTATVEGVPLPYGADRFVLHGLIHRAQQQNDPLITFEQAGDLLALFDLDRGGKNYERLRQRLRRIAGLDIGIRPKASEIEADAGWGSRVVELWNLPTRKQLKGRKDDGGQLSLPGVDHFVRLSESVMRYLREGGRNILLVRLDLLKLFVDNPTAWDYLMFLTARCGAAKTPSVVPHEALIEMFGQGEEPDRVTIHRIRKIHEQLVEASRDDKGRPRLDARLEVIGQFPSKGRGRPAKKWGLKIFPSSGDNWLIEKGSNSRALDEVLEVAEHPGEGDRYHLGDAEEDEAGERES